MRIACCIYGTVGGSKGKDGAGGHRDDILRLGYKHLKKRIINKNDSIDFFIHCWDTDMEEKIKQLYRPKSCHFEKQVYFDIPECVQGKELSTPNNIYSRWYSTKKSVQLKKDYESKHGFKYDCVLLSRFDIAWRNDFIFSKFNMDYFHAAHICFYFQGKRRIKAVDFYARREYFKKLQLYHRHMGYPKQENTWGLWDTWFLSSSENIDKFSELFDNIEMHVLANDKLGKRVNNHMLSEVQVKHIGLGDKVELIFHYLEETPVVRMWYYDRFN